MTGLLACAKRTLIGRLMRSNAMGHQFLPKRIALLIFASDALSSAAYVPDEILLTLALAGSMAALQSVWVGVVVAIIFAVVVASYRQTVHAYPSGGGDCGIVTMNLGRSWGLLVVSALLIDYILTIAVSISSGTSCITTAVPALLGHKVLIMIAPVVILATLNLCGTREAGGAFAVPTYLYMEVVGLMVVVGFAKMATRYLGESPTAAYGLMIAPGNVDGLTGLAGALLLIHAFSSGCVALAGVETIPGGVPMFRRPKSRSTATTLAMLDLIATSMMISILVLAHATGMKIVDDAVTQLAYQGTPVPKNTPIGPAISRITSTVFGQGSILFILITIVAGFIPVLAGNMTLDNFPMLASVLSRDSFLSHQMVRRGDRLSHSNDIVVLTVTAIALIVGFEAQTTCLIQFYVVGVFIFFILSQLGIVKHWNQQLRSRQSGQGRMTVLRSHAINIVGFVVTDLMLIIVLATKFTHGAWIALLMVAIMFGIQILIYHHYEAVRSQLRVDDWSTRHALPTRVCALVLVSSLSRPAMRAIAAVRASLPTSIKLVSVIEDGEEENRIPRQWKASNVPVPLTLLSAPYRDIASVVPQYVHGRRRAMPTEIFVVYMPQFLVTH